MVALRAVTLSVTQQQDDGDEAPEPRHEDVGVAFGLREVGGELGWLQEVPQRVVP